MNYGESMVIEKGVNKLITKQDFGHIAILLAIALGIGIYLIATTVLISKDGVYYIGHAQQFLSNPIDIVKNYSPGYPFLIFLAHKFTSFFVDSTSNQTWIYSAQGVTLLCRLLAIIPLYFMGKLLVGSKNSFLAILILIFLPIPAKFVCDIVREWPHLLFLATGLLFLMWGSRKGRWWMFALAGLAGGLGQTIRPEGAQIVLYAMMWAVITLFHQRKNVDKLKTICLTTILIVGFLIPAVPYMKIRGKIVPAQLRNLFTSNTVYSPDATIDIELFKTESVHMASAIPSDILKSLSKLLTRLSENLNYFFVLPLIVGLYCHFRRMRNILLTESFFIFALIVLYIVMMVLLYINCGYMSRRHCMPIVVFTVFYIPEGLRIIGSWLDNKWSVLKQKTDIPEKKRLTFFVILFLIGIGICMPKLLRPVRIKKQGYRDAATWLKENTAPTDITAVPDRRIAFYAERKGLFYDKVVPEQVKYVVRIAKDEEGMAKFEGTGREKYSVWANKRKKKKRIFIYEMF